MKNNNLKRKLNSDQVALGSWITFQSDKSIEVLSNFPFDWLCLDIEHNLFNNETLLNLIRTIQYYDKAALVRIDSNDPVIIKKCLDAGADGLIIPMINSAKDAMNAVRSSYYPPIGNRGVGLSRAQKYGLEFANYKDWIKENLVIIAQIEHHEGIANLSEIVEVNGIDGFIIGPYDLSASIGYPGDLESLEMKEMMKKFQSICTKAGKAYGEHIVYPDKIKLKKLIESGARFIAYGTDFNFMIKGLRDGVYTKTD